MSKFKIVWSSGVTESFSVECDEPVRAVRAYVESLVASGACGAKVYPAEDKPLLEVGLTPKPQVGSKLFEGYTDKELTSIAAAAHKCCGGKQCVIPPPVGPATAKFNTPSSTWIDHISWERKNSSLCVHFLRGGFIVYTSDYPTFENFKLWVTAGGSAGEYYNENIKGLPVLKRS